MKTEVKEISQTQREIHIDIPADRFAKAYAEVSKRYAKRANVPGFRKGLAPLDVIRLRYKDEIRGEVLQLVLPDIAADAVRENGIQPISEPHLHIDDAENIKVNGSENVKLHVHVEVMPEIPEPNYKGLEIVRRVKPVEDAEVEDLIEHRRQREAALIPVEGRTSEMGDTVIADLEGRFDDEPDGEPIRADALEIKLGDEVIERAFTEHLTGVREDEEKEFTVSYPADFSSSALAGRTVHYKAKINSVGRTEAPELNDEWAKSLDDGYESLADLRKKLRADLETFARADADARVRNIAIAKLIEENSFEVPNTLIESQSRNLLNNFAHDLQQRGVDLSKVGNDFVQMAYGQMRTQAERDVRGAMLLEKVAQAEAIQVSAEEVDAEIGRLAEHHGSTPEEVKAALEKQGGSATVRNNVMTRKAIETIVGAAKVTEGEWVDEAEAAEVEETEEPKKAKKGSGPKKAARSKG